MEYFYFFTDTKDLLWAIEYLTQQHFMVLDYITVVHVPDGLLLRIKLARSSEPQLEANFLAVMNEFGQAYSPSCAMKMVLGKLSEGRALTEMMQEVMQRHGIAIVTHGKPDCQ
ncbi:hypothetical protein [Acaryochloris sp. CCMEE 5410]|uniref:hypothetical protein n=1 Tax=Acaryochloris sp. CCMEE 5410 TaxID=310037 RepID=UPI0002484263|nr:hypothetical protein [Acaryochloris sp. CCMEE 5410]KAI9129073.1 hypothetical protein ON05_036670 [Acaryochloris sp. CCMEE 5410]